MDALQMYEFSSIEIVDALTEFQPVKDQPRKYKNKLKNFILSFGLMDEKAPHFQQDFDALAGYSRAGAMIVSNQKCGYLYVNKVALNNTDPGILDRFNESVKIVEVDIMDWPEGFSYEYAVPQWKNNR